MCTANLNPSKNCALSFNPSYQTNEVTFGSCPYGSQTFSTPEDQKEWTRNYPLVQGDSVLGVYGETYRRFGSPPTSCIKCGTCEQNTVSPLFYRPIRSYVHPTYGFGYMGKNDYYRKPY